MASTQPLDPRLKIYTLSNTKIIYKFIKATHSTEIFSAANTNQYFLQRIFLFFSVCQEKIRILL